MKKQKLFFIIGIIFLCIVAWLFFDKMFTKTKNFENFSKNIVQIHSESFGNYFSGMWYLDNNIIVTASHVLPENTEYRVNGEKFFLLHRDKKNDIAYIAKNPEQNFQKIIFASANIDDEIFIFVMRNNKIQKLSGKILETNANMNAFWVNGKIFPLQNIIRTNIEAKKGDSGTPIWNKNFEIVGLVHTEEK